jgi:hypothetical protein
MSNRPSAPVPIANVFGRFSNTPETVNRERPHGVAIQGNVHHSHAPGRFRPKMASQLMTT